MKNCLGCKHFSFAFSENQVWSEVTIDYGEFHIICMKQHFNYDGEETDEVVLYNLLIAGRDTCPDREKSGRICECGRRGYQCNSSCPACQTPFSTKHRE